jgi:lysozyme
MRYIVVLCLLAATAIAGPACLNHPKDGCYTPEGNGKCMSTSSCGGKSVAGYCPGDASIQCCMDSSSGSSGSSSDSASSTTSETNKHQHSTAAATTSPSTSEATTMSTKTSSKDKITSTDKNETTTTSHHSSSTEHKTTSHHTITTSAAAKASDGGGKVNSAGLSLIEGEEGFRSDWYYIDGDKTIGYGHDCTQQGDCSSIHAPLSHSEGEKLLKEDVAGFEKCVCDMKHASDLNMYQFGALVSFAYNCGCGGINNYFASYMDKKDFGGICKALPSTNTLGGELDSRRKKEGDFCSKHTDEKSGC